MSHESIRYCTFSHESLRSPNSTQLREFPVLTPPIPEQQKIAQILSTWDKAIEKLEALIAAKQKRKKALMQRLLTGKVRFYEFDEEYTEYKLEHLCNFKRGKGLSKEMLHSDGNFKCILYGELYTKYSEFIDQVISRTDATDSIKSVCGDILMPSSTTTSGIDLANAVALLEDDVLLGGDINILRPDLTRVYSEFLAYLLTHIKKNQIASKAQGITIIHLYGSDLKKLCVNLPTIKEQQKIAGTLSTADREIKIHQKQLTALKQQKKALMQQLLTGKKRVMVAEAA
ncbi:restriction endonuclease subunit S [Methylovulum psychrotolerans]|uniref:restriction endonuclease subunit S n=1 Tax=Methylovulum psychrotolerans TaxID=1704499 RepID=UPI001BFF82F6|nr:restriction endonuclease subunit S [Methylovulum psychrotolerans]MBT9100490.1 restriction endonuclease subunit S [Methylovulum psychrotolerans]